jgi:hypothetical protein
LSNQKTPGRGDIHHNNLKSGLISCGKTTTTETTDLQVITVTANTIGLNFYILGISDNNSSDSLTNGITMDSVILSQ